VHTVLGHKKNIQRKCPLPRSRWNGAPTLLLSVPKKIKQIVHWLDLDVDGTGPLEKTLTFTLGHKLNLRKCPSVRPRHRWNRPPRENTQLFKSRLSTTFPGYLCRMVGPRDPITTHNLLNFRFIPCWLHVLPIISLHYRSTPCHLHILPIINCYIFGLFRPIYTSSQS